MCCLPYEYHNLFKESNSNKYFLVSAALVVGTRNVGTEMSNGVTDSWQRSSRKKWHQSRISRTGLQFSSTKLPCPLLNVSHPPPPSFLLNSWSLGQGHQIWLYSTLTRKCSQRQLRGPTLKQSLCSLRSKGKMILMPPGNLWSRQLWGSVTTLNGIRPVY